VRLFPGDTTPGGMALDHFRLVLLSVARARFGPTARQRWVVGVCPCTAPSLELDVWSGGECLELLGAGLLHLTVLEAGGVDARD